MQRKYPGPLKSFAEELFFKKGIGEFVRIPYSTIEPLRLGQQGNYRDVTRRAFCTSIAMFLGKSQREVCTGKPSVMYQLCSFSQGDSAVKVTKKKDLEDFK